MSKSSTLKAIAVLLLVGVVSFVAWDNQEQDVQASPRMLITYQTNSIRSANVQKYCPGSVDRTTLVTSSDLAAAKTNQNTVSSTLGIDGNLLIYKLANGDTGGAMSMITSNVVSLAIFVGVFLVPFIVFLWVWPFLCCCCCCPQCCPSKCCQHPADEPYTKCELLWPTVTLIIALLLVISTSIYGFVNASNVGPSFNNMACSLAIFTDDLLNGNVTLNGSSFFTGLTLFSSNLNNLDSNLTNIQTYLSDLSNTAGGTTKTDVTNIANVEANYVKIIPDNAGTAAMNLVYNTPINSPSSTLASTLNSILGTYTTNGSLMYNLYASIEYARLMMQGIKDSSNSFSTQVGTIQSQIVPMQTTINGLVTDVSKMDDNLGTYLSYIKTPGTYGNMGMQAYYGFLIGFSFFSLLGVLLMACCDKPGCRHLMYLTCIFLFIGALVGFIVSVIFSILVPFFTWTCSYISVAVGSSSGFSTNFGAFLSASTINKITVCMPYGDGNIVNTVAGSAANGINNLTSVISSLNTFNNVTLQNYISGNLTNLVDTVDAYASGDISDLDTTNNNILAGLRDPSNTTNNASCTSFTDSWVPSNNQRSGYSTAISCMSTSGHTGQISNCGSTLLTGPNCDGCMDTTQLLNQYTTAAGVSGAITGKYGAGCAFANVLGNIWTNYFGIKKSILGCSTAATSAAAVSAGCSAGTNVQIRIKNAKTQITDTTSTTSVYYSIDQFRGIVNTVNTNLATIQSLTDPTYGMLAGLNCKLFGQDFVTFQNVICGSFYNNLYIIRLTFGITAWGILFVLCCSVCSGVRHFKQIDKMKKIADSNFKNDFDEGTKNDLKK